MKELIFKIILFISVIFLVLFLYIERFPMYYNSVDNTRWDYFKQVFDGNINIKKSSILFFGDSRLNTNVDVKKISNAWSFAAGGSSPIEMYYALNNYISLYGKPDTVFISFSPRTLIEAYSFWGYTIRNNYIKHADFQEVYHQWTKNKSDQVLGNNPYLKYLLYRINYIEFYQTDIYKNHIFLAKQKNEELIKAFQSEKGVWNYPNLKNGCSDFNYETKLETFNSSDLLHFYFIKILELCKREGIHVIFDFMPMNKTSFSHLNLNFVKEYKRYIYKLAQEFPEFEISDTMYFFKDQYFGDASHLNKEGKKIFTKYILDKYFPSTK